MLFRPSVTCISKQDLTKQKSFTQSETLRKLWIKFCVLKGLGKHNEKKQNISQLCLSTKCTTCFAKKEQRGKTFLLTKSLFAVPIQILQEKPYYPPWLPSWTTLRQAEMTHDLDLCSTVGILRLLKLDKKKSLLNR